ncbi:MAG: hypothetical protein LBI92_07810 [Azoarcus sp.]|jgi:hypothetical protein|nr:hypothetical protein [Azoarcus sp.]
MITRSRPPRNPLGEAELDVASTLINEANALLRLHGEDPNNDGTGDDLPVLTEVIFDLGEQAAAKANAGMRSNAPGTRSTVPGTRSTAPGTRSMPPGARNAQNTTAKAAPETPAPEKLAGAEKPVPAKPAPTRPVPTPAPAPTRPLPARAAPPVPSSPSLPFSIPGIHATRAPAAAAPPAPSSVPRPPTPPPPSVPRPPMSFSAPPRATIASQSNFFGTSTTPVRPPAWPAMPTPKPPAGIASRPPAPKVPPPVRPPAPAATAPARPAPRPAAPLIDTAAQTRAFTNDLKQLDTAITEAVETWARNELPALLSREIAKFSDHLRTEALTQLRATLLPRLHARFAAQIDQTGKK